VAAILGKETTSGYLPRAYPLEPTGYLRDMVLSTADRSKWRERIPDSFQFASRVKEGSLASGNKVLADEEGIIWQSAKSINDEIVAVETEAFGFYKAMEPLHRPFLMIRGISDLLTNKNTAGKRVDDNRQTKATAHAAALAAQLILDVEYKTLNRTRGVTPSLFDSKLLGFWRSEWRYGTELCEDLISIDEIDALGHVLGRRISVMSEYEYAYDVSGTLYLDQLHLTAIPSGRDERISISLALKVSGNFSDSLTGVAIRPMGNGPPPKFGSDVLLLHSDRIWASAVTYERIHDPRNEEARLWSVYERLR
jgi:hypothetical protein